MFFSKSTLKKMNIIPGRGCVLVVLQGRAEGSHTFQASNPRTLQAVWDMGQGYNTDNLYHDN